jgi:segregation and condensation protein B
LSQLPPLREFKELGESEQAMLPIDESEAVGGESVVSTAEASPENPVEEFTEPAAFSAVNGDGELLSETAASESDSQSELMVAEVAEES